MVKSDCNPSALSDTNFSDPQCLKCLRKRYQAAWEAIAEAYLPQLLRAGRGMGFSADEAQDLAQSAFVALMEGIGRFEGHAPIRTFLSGIFYNKITERLREIQKERANVSMGEIMGARSENSALRSPRDTISHLTTMVRRHHVRLTGAALNRTTCSRSYRAC